MIRLEVGDGSCLKWGVSSSHSQGVGHGEHRNVYHPDVEAIGR